MYNTSHKCADKEHDSLIIQKRSFNRNGKGERDEARRAGIPGHAEGLLYAGIKLKKHSSGLLFLVGTLILFIVPVALTLQG